MRGQLKRTYPRNSRGTTRSAFTQRQPITGPDTEKRARAIGPAIGAHELHAAMQIHPDRAARAGHGGTGLRDVCDSLSRARVRGRSRSSAAFEAGRIPRRWPCHDRPR